MPSILSVHLQSTDYFTRLYLSPFDAISYCAIGATLDHHIPTEPLAGGRILRRGWRIAEVRRAEDIVGSVGSVGADPRRRVQRAAFLTSI